MIQNTVKVQRTNEEFARNYKRALQDGIFGPVAVGNINKYVDKNTGEERMIVNLCMKTIRSGERNATYSQPSDWRLKFGTGEHVNVLVQNGYVSKIMPIVARTLTSDVAKAIQDSFEQEITAEPTGSEVEANATILQA